VCERALLKWLVSVPSSEQEAAARRISQSQINRLEELWKERPNANVDELDTSAPETHLQQVPLRYSIIHALLTVT
jgi:regulator of nonsense transcripts 1